jgi:endogenous inhibitor of DNA gyrase (YacG/DUF329 family)
MNYGSHGCKLSYYRPTSLERTMISMYCPYCGKEISDRLIDNFIDIIVASSRFKLECPHCEKSLRVKANVHFDLSPLEQKET